MSAMDEYRARLHKAAITIKELGAKLEAAQKRASEPVAVIGVGCRFPGGGVHPEAFFEALEAGVDGVRRIPPERWSAEAVAPGRPELRWAGLLDAVDEFDAAFFGISPREAVRLDPQQRLLLEVTWEALERAGQRADRLLGSRTGVFVGMWRADYGRFVREAPVDAYSVSGSLLSTAAGRVSYTFGLQGPCMIIDTACSSSLVAVHTACQSLRTGECDLALAGGANLLLDPVGIAMMLEMHMLSPDGRCKTFDAGANGIVGAEGCGVVVLKRLSDAERDGDPIAAVIRGSAVNQDGRSTGLTAPNVLAQQALLQQALESARVSASDIGYVETHGTGTSLGDPIEFEALRAVLGAPRADGAKCVLGALKTNLGHMDAVAGVAGLIKAILCLQRGAIPKNLHFETLNPRMSLEGTPFVIPTETLPFPANGEPRRAGVSSFGMSGTNAHVILEEAPRQGEADAHVKRASSYLVPLSAKTKAALVALAAATRDHLARTGATLHDIAYTASARRSLHEHRLGVVGASKDEVVAALSAYARGEIPAGLAEGQAQSAPPKVVFVFPGQGSQWVGMGRRLLEEEPVFREAIAACDAAIQREAGFSVLDELRADEARSRLAAIDVVQPVLFAVEVALAALWRSWGVEPDAVVGHSMGEVAAAHVAGALSLQDAAAVICRRSRLLRGVSGKGAMALVELSLADAERALSGHEDRLSVAVSNGPRATVIAGDPASLEGVLARLEREQIFCRRVKVDVASHSPQMDVLRDDLLAALRGVAPAAARIPMTSTVTAEPLRGDELVAAYWADNLRRPVLFSRVVSGWIAAGHTIFVEMSPHPILLPSVEENLREAGAAGAALPSLRRGQDERLSLLDSLGRLHVRGCPVAWERLYPEGGRVVELPAYPWQRERYWLESPGRGRAAARGAGAAGARGGASHPLLGGAFSYSLRPEDEGWEQEISVERLGYLADHRVQGEVVFPGAGYVEMALSAGAERWGTRELRLDEVTFEQVLVLPAQDRRVVQVVLSEEGEQGAWVQISSRAEESRSWTRHARARVRRVPREPGGEGAEEPPRARAERLQPSEPGAAFYGRIREAQIDYGPAFQGVEEVWSGAGEAVARVRLPEGVDEGGYVVHPALLDACLQVSAALFGDTTETVVPVGIERVQVHARAPRQGWVVATRAAESEAAAGERRCDVRLVDDEGRSLMEVRGLRLRRLEGSLVEQDALEGCVHEVVWRRAERLPEPSLGATGAWVVFSDRGGVGAGLHGRLTGAGQRCVRVFAGEGYEQIEPDLYRIDPGKRDDYARLLREAFGEEGSCGGVVHLFSLDAAPIEAATAEALAAELAGGSVSAAYLTQALVRHGFRDAPRLFLVTRGAQGVHEHEAVSVGQAPVWGLGRTIALEHPEVQCTRIDLAPGASEADAARLARELGAAGPEDQVALRGDDRYVARLVRGRFEAESARRFSLRPDASYLITGGLGGLGLSLARWLVEQGARHVALVGRRGAGPEAQQAIREMEEAGARVLVEPADVSCRDEVERLFARVEEKLPPLCGIVHAAAVLDDHTLLEQSEESFRKVFGPKALGAWHLHALSEGRALDFFVMYSSGASLFGSPGQGNYAAASAFVDALSRERARRGLASMSIQWGAFAEVGLAAAQDNRGKRLSSRGVASFTPAEGLEALRRLLLNPRAEVGVVRFDARQWSEFYPVAASLPLFAELTQDGAPGRVDREAPRVRQALEEAAPHERLPLLERHLCEQVAAVLRLDPRRLDRGAPFQSLGMDSLMSLELRNRFEASLGIRLSAILLFTYPNVSALSRHLLAMLSPSPETSGGAARGARGAKTADDGADVRPDITSEVEGLSRDELRDALARELEDE
uniref:Polyketide synthase n=1 Tax=Sorangium cellulosum TaxID=56 RepID=I0J6Y8_SORCE|nr:polyketide synthase [Sorangium cellulosum]